VRENLAGIFEDLDVSKHSQPNLFALGVKTKVGDIKLHGVIFALRFLASYLEEKEKAGLIKKRVQFSLEVYENGKKGVVTL
jgi:hypothetical protein